MPLDNYELIGTWRFNDTPSIPGNDPTVQTFSTAADSRGYGDFEFRVNYDPDDSTKYKEFYIFVAERDNDKGEASIHYWPVGAYGTTVYSDTKGGWNPTESSAKNWGYDLSNNRTITVTKSTLTYEGHATKLLTWFRANATKIS